MTWKGWTWIRAVLAKGRVQTDLARLPPRRTARAQPTPLSRVTDCCSKVLTALPRLTCGAHKPRRSLRPIIFTTPTALTPPATRQRAQPATSKYRAPRATRRSTVSSTPAPVATIIPPPAINPLALRRKQPSVISAPLQAMTWSRSIVTTTPQPAIISSARRRRRPAVT